MESLQDARMKPSRSKSDKAKSSVHFQDSVTFVIPLHVTVDIGVAMRRTRKKRRQKLFEAFPELKEAANRSTQTNANDGEGSNDDEDEGKKADSDLEQTNRSKKRLHNGSIRPQDFSSTLDYLEAKYVQGVMINDEDEDQDDGSSDENEESRKKRKRDEDDEGDGSVYSESSFLDDKDLQRHVAEQVLAQATTTKMELEGEDDFFVNVGNLEVEETELTKEHYDPLEDSQKKKAPKKRKRPTSVGSSKSEKSGNADSAGDKKSSLTTKEKKGDKLEKSTNSAASKKSKTSTSSVSRKKNKMPTREKEPKPQNGDDGENDESDSDPNNAAASSVPKKNSNRKQLPTSPKVDPEELERLKAMMKETREAVDKIQDSIASLVKNLSAEEIPRKRPTKSKVALSCPPNKKPGDVVTFSNPHIPGQRLRVKVPKDTKPGDTFKVTVPVPEASDGEDDGADHNRFSRHFQETMDDFSRAYDDWCQAVGDFNQAKGTPGDFIVHQEKRIKFADIVKEFPKNLKTEVDETYLRKMVRRARQNRHKRSKTAAARKQHPPSTGSGSTVTGRSKDGGDGDGDDDDAMEGQDNDVKQEDKIPSVLALHVPVKSSRFPVMEFDWKSFG